MKTDIIDLTFSRNMTERLDRATTCNVKKAMLMHLHYFLIVYA